MRTGLIIRRSLAGLAAAAVFAATASCGGDSSTSPEEFEADANRVCRDAERELDRIQARAPETAVQAENQAEALIDVSDQALDNLGKIEPPENLERAYDRYLQQREGGIAFIEDARDAAADNDSDAYVRAKRRLAEGQPTRRQLALELGLDACSRPSLPAGAR
jgi:hypothetical protein